MTPRPFRELMGDSTTSALYLKRNPGSLYRSNRSSTVDPELSVFSAFGTNSHTDLQEGSGGLRHISFQNGQVKEQGWGCYSMESNDSVLYSYPHPCVRWRPSNGIGQLASPPRSVLWSVCLTRAGPHHKLCWTDWLQILLTPHH